MSIEQKNDTLTQPKMKRTRKPSTKKSLQQDKDQSQDTQKNDIECQIPIQTQIQTINTNDSFSNLDDEMIQECSEDCFQENSQKIPKKRGRKPKGGKIIKPPQDKDDNIHAKPNIILHIKCSLSELNDNVFSLGGVNYDPHVVENVDGYSFSINKELSYDYIEKEEKIEQKQYTTDNTTNNQVTSNVDTDDNNIKDIWKNLSELEVQLHNNDTSDKKSACFWDTCDFDNPPIYIPKYELNGTIHVYGCFCCPECGVAFLMRENIDAATKFERYHLMNRIYGKIYNYEKNIKPAPNPYYTLDKYYGNLSVPQYRKLLKHERLLLIVDKPLTRQLPELHQDNDDFIINNNSIPSSKYKLRRKGNKQTKNDILNEKFGIK